MEETRRSESAYKICIDSLRKMGITPEQLLIYDTADGLGRNDPEAVTIACIMLTNADYFKSEGEVWEAALDEEFAEISEKYKDEFLHIQRVEDLPEECRKCIRHFRLV